MRRFHHALLLLLTSAGFCATDAKASEPAAGGDSAGSPAPAGAAALAAEAEEARAALAAVRAERDEYRARAEALERRAEELQGTIRDLSEALGSARSQVDRLRKQCEENVLDRALVGGWTGDDDAAALRKRMESVCRELLVLRRERDRLAERLEALLARLDAQPADAALRVEIAAGRAALEELARPRPQEDAGATDPAFADVSGCRVLSVNPDLNVVVLTAGGRHGVRAGMEMDILRADRPVARVRVVETRERVCAAVIQESDRAEGPRVGDLARPAASGS